MKKKISIFGDIDFDFVWVISVVESNVLAKDDILSNFSSFCVFSVQNILLCFLSFIITRKTRLLCVYYTKYRIFSNDALTPFFRGKCVIKVFFKYLFLSHNNKFSKNFHVILKEKHTLRFCSNGISRQYIVLH